MPLAPMDPFASHAPADPFAGESNPVPNTTISGHLAFEPFASNAPFDPFAGGAAPDPDTMEPDSMKSEDEPRLPSEEHVLEFWSKVLGGSETKGRFPVLLTGSTIFESGLEDGRFLKPLVEAVAQLLAHHRIRDKILLIGCRTDGGDSRQWDNCIQETFFDVAAKDGALPMMQLRFSEHAGEDGKEALVEPGCPIKVHVKQQAAGGDWDAWAQGWVSAATPCVLGFGGGTNAFHMLCRRGSGGRMTEDFKELALPVPAAGGMNMERVAGEGASTPFRPNPLPETQWTELMATTEGDTLIESADHREAYAAKVLDALEILVDHGVAAPLAKFLEPAPEGDPSHLSATEDLGPSFPECLGPFKLVPTTYRPADFRVARDSWTLAPRSIQGAIRRRIGAASFISGQLSPQQPVTLSAEDRAVAGIPEKAVYFSWSYPIEREFPRQAGDMSPDVAFLAFGGYTYFSANGKSVVATLALLPSDDGGLRFGDPLPWPAVMTQRVGEHRFHPVTIPALREVGARYFCWLSPREVKEAEHGAFAYLFHDKLFHKKRASMFSMTMYDDMYFPVLGKSAPMPANRTVSKAKACPSGRVPAQGNASRAPSKSSTRPRSAKSQSLPEYPRAPWHSQLTVSVVPEKEPAQGDLNLVVSLQPPAGATSAKSHICCVLDVSGSMNSEAVLQGGSGNVERHGLTLLDIAKHGVRTLIHTLADQDRLSVVSFNIKASVVVPSMKMDAAGKAQAERLLDRLQATGGTDIWEGLRVALQHSSEHRLNGMFSHIMLLTDGRTRTGCLKGSTSGGAENVISNLCRSKALNSQCSINTFGFGYDIDSKLLADIAEEGRGSYSFIPDAGFVGTVFVNTLSNLMVTMAKDVQVELLPGRGAEIVQVHGFRSKQEQGRTVVHIGNAQFGQTRDVLVSMKLSSAEGVYLSVGARYEIAGGALRAKGMACGSEQVEVSRTSELPAGYAQKVSKQFCRSVFVEKLQLAVSRLQIADGTAHISLALALMNGAVSEIEASAAAQDQDVLALLEDGRGQVAESLSRKEWYDKWGKHYLPSLMFAHRLQLCNNFKDPGVQVYGGVLFETIRDHADDVFNSLPPPKPSARPVEASAPPAAGRTQNQPAPVCTPPTSMSAYNNCYGG